MRGEKGAEDTQGARNGAGELRAATPADSRGEAAEPTGKLGLRIGETIAVAGPE